MQIKTYKSRTGKQQFRPVMDEAEYRAVDNEGFCVACGETQDNVEPDAEHYPCEACHELKVYGMEQLFIMGLLSVIFDGATVPVNSEGRTFKGDLYKMYPEVAS